MQHIHKTLLELLLASLTVVILTGLIIMRNCICMVYKINFEFPEQSRKALKLGILSSYLAIDIVSSCKLFSIFHALFSIIVTEFSKRSHVAIIKKLPL